MSKTTEPAVDFSKELLQASADEALSVLQSSDRPDALVEAWIRSGNSAAVASVAERGNGPARKAARRGLNVLRSRGVKVDQPSRVVSLRAPSVGETSVDAWLVPPDPGGTVLIVIAQRSVTSRAQSGFFYLHDSVGVHQASVGELSGGKLKDALKRAALSGLEPVRVPVTYARWRIARARSEQKARGIPEPLGLTSARELLTPVPETEEPHPLDGEGLELADEDAKEMAQNSVALHMLPEFRGWMPDRPAVDEMLAEAGKHLSPGQEPNPEEFRKSLEEAVNAATDRYFQPERRAGLVRLMKDAALSVLATQGEVRALEVVATLKRVESAGLITDPPHEVPFLRGFFDKAIATLAMQGQGKLQIPIGAASTQAAAASGELGAPSSG